MYIATACTHIHPLAIRSPSSSPAFVLPPTAGGDWCEWFVALIIHLAQTGIGTGIVAQQAQRVECGSWALAEARALQSAVSWVVPIACHVLLGRSLSREAEKHSFRIEGFRLENLCLVAL